MQNNFLCAQETFLAIHHDDCGILVRAYTDVSEAYNEALTTLNNILEDLDLSAGEYEDRVQLSAGWDAFPGMSDIDRYRMFTRAKGVDYNVCSAFIDEEPYTTLYVLHTTIKQAIQDE